MELGNHKHNPQPENNVAVPDWINELFHRSGALCHAPILNLFSLFSHLLFCTIIDRCYSYTFFVSICCCECLLCWSQSCLHTVCFFNSSWFHIPLHNWNCEVAGSPLFHCENIKLIAVSPRDFAHPSQSLGNNLWLFFCSSLLCSWTNGWRLRANASRDALCLWRRLTRWGRARCRLKWNTHSIRNMSFICHFCSNKIKS